jgi:protein TonB
MAATEKTRSAVRLPQTYMKKFVPDNNLVMGIPDAPPPPEPEGPVRFVVGGSMTEPVKLSGANPAYPEAARRARVQGVVVLELTIDTEGQVTRVRPLRPLPLGLTEAAVAAVQTWRFQPSTLNGRPVTTNYIITVRFLLNGAPAVAADSARAALQPETADIGALKTTDQSGSIPTGQTPETGNPLNETAVARAPIISRQPYEIVAAEMTAVTHRRLGLPAVSVAILASSLVLLIFATGAWLFQRRAIAN